MENKEEATVDNSNASNVNGEALFELSDEEFAEAESHELGPEWQLVSLDLFRLPNLNVKCTYNGCNQLGIYQVPIGLTETPAPITLCESHLQGKMQMRCNETHQFCSDQSKFKGRKFNIRPLYKPALEGLLALIQRSGWDVHSGAFEVTVVHNVNTKQLAFAVVAGQHRFESLHYLRKNKIGPAYFDIKLCLVGSEASLTKHGIAEQEKAQMVFKFTWLQLANLMATRIRQSALLDRYTKDELCEHLGLNGITDAIYGMRKISPEILKELVSLDYQCKNRLPMNKGQTCDFAKLPIEAQRNFWKAELYPKISQAVKEKNKSTTMKQLGIDFHKRLRHYLLQHCFSNYDCLNNLSLERKQAIEQASEEWSNSADNSSWPNFVKIATSLQFKPEWDPLVLNTPKKPLVSPHSIKKGRTKQSVQPTSPTRLPSTDKDSIIIDDDGDDNNDNTETSTLGLRAALGNLPSGDNAVQRPPSMPVAVQGQPTTTSNTTTFGTETATEDVQMMFESLHNANSRIDAALDDAYVDVGAYSSVDMFLDSQNNGAEEINGDQFAPSLSVDMDDMARHNVINDQAHVDLFGTDGMEDKQAEVFPRQAHSKQDSLAKHDNDAAQTDADAEAETGDANQRVCSPQSQHAHENEHQDVAEGNSNEAQARSSGCHQGNDCAQITEIDEHEDKNQDHDGGNTNGNTNEPQTEVDHANQETIPANDGEDVAVTKSNTDEDPVTNTDDAQAAVGDAYQVTLPANDGEDVTVTKDQRSSTDNAQTSDAHQETLPANNGNEVSKHQMSNTNDAQTQTGDAHEGGNSTQDKDVDEPKGDNMDTNDDEAFAEGKSDDAEMEDGELQPGEGNVSKNAKGKRVVQSESQQSIESSDEQAENDDNCQSSVSEPQAKQTENSEDQEEENSKDGVDGTAIVVGSKQAPRVATKKPRSAKQKESSSQASTQVFEANDRDDDATQVLAGGRFTPEVCSLTLASLQALDRKRTKILVLSTLHTAWSDAIIDAALRSLCIIETFPGASFANATHRLRFYYDEVSEYHLVTNHKPHAKIFTRNTEESLTRTMSAVADSPDNLTRLDIMVQAVVLVCQKKWRDFLVGYLDITKGFVGANVLLMQHNTKGVLTNFNYFLPDTQIKCPSWGWDYFDQFADKIIDKEVRDVQGEIPLAQLFRIELNLAFISGLPMSDVVHRARHDVPKTSTFPPYEPPKTDSTFGFGDYVDIAPLPGLYYPNVMPLIAPPSDLHTSLLLPSHSLRENLLYPGLYNSVWSTWSLGAYACPGVMFNHYNLNLFWFLAPNFKGSLYWFLPVNGIEWKDWKLQEGQCVVYQQKPGSGFVISPNVNFFSVVCLPTMGTGNRDNLANLLLYRCVTYADVSTKRTRLDPTLLFAVQRFPWSTDKIGRLEVVNTWDNWCFSIRRFNGALKTLGFESVNQGNICSGNACQTLLQSLCVFCKECQMLLCLRCAGACVVSEHHVFPKCALTDEPHKVVKYAVSGLIALLAKNEERCLLMEELLFREPRLSLPKNDLWLQNTVKLVANLLAPLSKKRKVSEGEANAPASPSKKPKHGDDATKTFNSVVDSDDVESDQI